MAALIWKTTNAGKRYPYAVYRQDGKLVWESLSRYAGKLITTKKDGLYFFKDWCRFGRRRVISPVDDLTSFLREYRRQSESYKSVTTRRADDSRLRVLMDWFADQDIRRLGQITPRVIDDFIAWKRRSCSATSVNRYLELIRAMLNVAVRWGYLKANPLANIKMLPRRGQRQVRALSEKEIRTIDQEFPSPLREFCALGIYAGLRLSEIVWLEWADVNFKAETITIQGKPEFSPKGLEPRTIPLAPQLKKALRVLTPAERFIFDKGTGEPLYYPNTWYRLVMAQFRRLGIKGANLHTLRHTFVTRLVRAGISPVIIQQLARHKDFKTTLRYTHIDQADLQAAIRKVPG